MVPTPPSSLSEFHAALLEFLITAKQGLMTAAKEYDLTIIQSMTIILIDIQKPKAMKDFQKIYACDASNVTGIVDGLEEKGLVVRGVDQNDRRIKTVLLTEKGKKTQQMLITGFRQVDDSILSSLTPMELSIFQAMMIKLSNRIY